MSGHQIIVRDKAITVDGVTKEVQTTLMGPIAVTKQKVTDIKERAADIKDVAVDKAHDAAAAVRNASATAVDRTREVADNAKQAATDKAQRVKGGIVERWRLWRNRNTNEEEESPPR